MAFPALNPKPDTRRGPGATSTIWAEATGIPANGPNVIALPFISEGVAPDDINEDWIDLRISALGPSVIGASFVSLAPDKQSMTINFVQAGADQATVRCRIYHSEIS